MAEAGMCHMLGQSDKTNPSEITCNKIGHYDMETCILFFDHDFK